MKLKLTDSRYIFIVHQLKMPVIVLPRSRSNYCVKDKRNGKPILLEDDNDQNE